MSQGTLWSSYVVDTSSFVELLQEDDPDAGWNVVVRLIRQDRLKTVGAVVAVLKDRMLPSGKFRDDWLAKLVELRQVAVLPDEEIIAAAADINIRHPRLGNAYGPYDKADPWIVGAAVTRGLVVVTEERDTNPGKKWRIPWVCDQENVPWCRLRRLLEES
jgi:predicted nucleic acid-binding protein